MGKEPSDSQLAVAGRLLEAHAFNTLVFQQLQQTIIFRLQLNELLERGVSAFKIEPSGWILVCCKIPKSCDALRDTLRRLIHH